MTSVSNYQPAPAAPSLPPSTERREEPVGDATKAFAAVKEEPKKSDPAPASKPSNPANEPDRIRHDIERRQQEQQEAKDAYDRDRNYLKKNALHLRTEWEQTRQRIEARQQALQRKTNKVAQENANLMHDRRQRIALLKEGVETVKSPDFAVPTPFKEKENEKIKEAYLKNTIAIETAVTRYEEGNRDGTRSMAEDDQAYSELLAELWSANADLERQLDHIEQAASEATTDKQIADEQTAIEQITDQKITDKQVIDKQITDPAPQSGAASPIPSSEKSGSTPSEPNKPSETAVTTAELKRTTAQLQRKTYKEKRNHLKDEARYILTELEKTRARIAARKLAPTEQTGQAAPSDADMMKERQQTVSALKNKVSELKSPNYAPITPFNEVGKEETKNAYVKYADAVSLAITQYEKDFHGKGPTAEDERYSDLLIKLVEAHTVLNRDLDEVQYRARSGQHLPWYLQFAFGRLFMASLSIGARFDDPD